MSEIPNKVKLMKGDQVTIACAVGTSRQTVNDVLAGRTGKRNTLLVRRIKAALEMRLCQNKQFTQFCKELRCEKIFPS